MENNKPLSLIINEFKDKIQNAVTESQLVPTILEMVFKDIYINIHEVAAQYEQQELQNYQNEINKENNENKDKEE